VEWQDRMFLDMASRRKVLAGILTGFIFLAIRNTVLLASTNSLLQLFGSVLLGKFLLPEMTEFARQ
jgi:hypothetical protein